MSITIHASGTIEGIDNDNFNSSLLGGRVGTVIQYVRGTTSQVNGRHSESAGNWESTGCSIAITPKRSDSLIVVGGWLNVYSDASNTQAFKFHNGSAFDTKWITYIASLGSGPWVHANVHYEQTSGTTSELTFTLYHARTQGSGNAYCGWESSPGATGNGQCLNALEVLV
jgi:hypothetical protein